MKKEESGETPPETTPEEEKDKNEPEKEGE